MQFFLYLILIALSLPSCSSDDSSSTTNGSSAPLINTYNLADTGIIEYYNDVTVIAAPLEGNAFYGQDAQYTNNSPSYTDNSDDTITDNVTGLMWQKYMGDKMAFEDAFDNASDSTTGGYTDWRAPTIKELYSLILFTGREGTNDSTTDGYKPFIDTNYFDQPYGSGIGDERVIDAQTWSSTEYVSVTMSGDETIFGVNFVDGRIKGYPKYKPRTSTPITMYFRFVRGNTNYGKNNFVDNGDGTISDLATGLMWQQTDSDASLDWREALEYAEDLDLSGYTDWRLPNAKELQSIVDYTRSPATTSSPAIDPLFQTTEIADPSGDSQYPYFWTSTTHQTGATIYAHAAYIAFGKAQGEIDGRLMDVHGAGAQRSDPKSGNAQDYPKFEGPQGDAQYVRNYVRCVRNIE